MGDDAGRTRGAAKPSASSASARSQSRARCSRRRFAGMPSSAYWHSRRLQPAAELDMSEIQAGRAFADYISAIGGDASSGNGGALASLSSWTKAPLLAYRILQEPGAYADTLTLRFDLKKALRTGSESTEANKAVSLASVDAAGISGHFCKLAHYEVTNPPAPPPRGMHLPTPARLGGRKSGRSRNPGMEGRCAKTQYGKVGANDRADLVQWGKEQGPYSRIP
eukprot:COSAG04_NODE_7046_length_1203_cov_1.332428_1_plen_222_part_10